MTEPLSPEEIKQATKIGLQNKIKPISSRLAEFSPYSIDQIGCFSIFNQSVSSEGIELFFIRSDLPFPSREETCEWILHSVKDALIQVNIDGDRIFYHPDEEAKLYFEKELPEVTKSRYHQNADRFYFEWLTSIERDRYFEEKPASQVIKE